MVALKARPKRTIDDYLKLPEGTLAELIEGEICMSPSPKNRHQGIVGNLYFLLRSFVEPRGLGQVLLAPDDVHLPSGDVVQPDVFFVSKEHATILRDWVRGTPDLLIEVLSPESVDRDRIIKKGLYARNRAPEYWIVDDEARAIEVFSLRGKEFDPQGFFREGDSLRSPLLSELSMAVRDVFA